MRQLAFSPAPREPGQETLAAWTPRRCGVKEAPTPQPASDSGSRTGSGSWLDVANGEDSRAGLAADCW